MEKATQHTVEKGSVPTLQFWLLPLLQIVNGILNEASWSNSHVPEL